MNNRSSNPWTRGQGQSNFSTRRKSNNRVVEQAPSIKDVEKRFQEASAKMQESVKKCMQEYDSSSDEEHIEGDGILDSVLKNYNQLSSDQNLGRTRHVLEESFLSNATACLICIATVKRIDPIWSCISCYSYFHLTCIQKWGQDTINQQMKENADIPIQVVKSRRKEWCCPKCRQSYTQDEIPQRYECFCKKQVNPNFQPWQLPHSCGNVCQKELLPACGHLCLLLCHPGPCPPCPKMDKKPCFCGQSQPKPVRCSSSKWSCGKICNRTLSCKKHRCNEVCHDGDCQSCPKISVQSCLCGNSSQSRPCSEPNWQCQKVCNKMYSCGHHCCYLICHRPNECGDCPHSGLQTCPCGKICKMVICPEEVTPCGDTCHKLLACGEHICYNKCHKAPCPPCLVMVDKLCRCGNSSRQLPCSKEYTCDTKCGKIRTCGRHTCTRKCCLDSCPPCNKPCGQKLQCGKHRCSALCHSGPCYPCPLTSKVACRCGQTFLIVPCGREKRTKPPKCSKQCQIPYRCDHGSDNKHQCHFGACPPCTSICGKVIQGCGHSCKAKCHEAVAMVFEQAIKPATPWEIQPPRVEICRLDCPPCETPVPILCLGGHEEITQPCFAAKRMSCGRLCNEKLQCGNHTCNLICHALVTDEKSNIFAKECSQCDRECEVPRPIGCDHQCPKGACHPSPCPECQRMVRVTCHCGLIEPYLRCYDIVKACLDPEFKEKIYSCGQNCIKLLDCGHHCRKICHSGICEIDQICNKKNKVYCRCKNVKKEFQCVLVQAGNVEVECEDSCFLKIKQQEDAARKKKEAEEEKNQRELLEYELKFIKKKTKDKKRKIVLEKDNGFFSSHLNVFVSVGVVIGFIAIAIYSIYLTP